MVEVGKMTRTGKDGKGQGGRGREPKNFFREERNQRNASNKRWVSLSASTSVHPSAMTCSRRTFGADLVAGKGLCFVHFTFLDGDPFLVLVWFGSPWGSRSGTSMNECKHDKVMIATFTTLGAGKRFGLVHAVVTRAGKGARVLLSKTNARGLSRARTMPTTYSFATSKFNGIYCCCSLAQAEGGLH